MKKDSEHEKNGDNQGIKPLLIGILVLSFASTTFQALTFFKARLAVSVGTAQNLKISPYNAPISQPQTDAKTDASIPQQTAQTPDTPPSPEAQDLQTGDDAPAFALKDINGNWVSLGTFRKTKNVVLMVWLSSCSHCLEFLPRFNNFVKTVKGNKKIQVLTVTRAVLPGEKDELRIFLKQNNYSFPVLLSEDDQFGQDYRLQTIPSIWIIDSSLKIRGVLKGNDLTTADLESLFLKPLGL